MKEKAIQIIDVKKKYRLGTIGGGTLQGDLQSWIARKQGKEDPNIKIGQEVQNNQTEFMALNGISLDVYKGETLGIIGGNGAGKSTLLKLLSQVTAPTQGEIRINGRISSMLEVGTGFHSELTGRENIYLNGAILGMSKKEVDSKINDIIEFSECGKFIDTPVKRYSSGMYVKLAFSVAAHLDSEILVMDEVLAVGDMKFQEKCLGKMGDVSSKEGRTVLYVSHNMNTIRSLCSRCIVLDKGRKIYDGDVETAIQIYMGNLECDKPMMQLSGIKREGSYENHVVTMESFSVVECKESIFKVNSKLECKLIVSTIQNLENVQMRIRIHHVDGTPVTMMQCDRGYDLKENKDNIVNFEIDLEHIVPGKYSMGIILYQQNSFGSDGPLDGLDDFFTFEIVTDRKFNKQLEWRRKYWGNVSLHNVKVVDVR